MIAKKYKQKSEAVMSKFLQFCVLAVLLAACGGAPQFSAPRNLDDACLLVRERPQYLIATRNAERRWGIPVPVQMAIIHAESRFIGDARTPYRFTLGVIPMGRQSSAYGYSQALDGTWGEYVKATGNRRGERTNIHHATDFIGWYAMQSNQRNGVPLNDARNLYLAYHEGQTGFARASYNEKPWLVAVADRVASRAVMYDEQLRACGRR
jgi:hypothetical protein